MTGAPNQTISVIIPTLNEAEALGHCLAQFERLPGSWQLIVVDSGSVDSTVAIARHAGALVIENAPTGRGAAMNAGVSLATGDILLFLHADTLLPAEAHDTIRSKLDSPNIAATGFRLRMDRKEWRFRVLTPISTARFMVQRTLFGDQAIAVRRLDFVRVGGYREAFLMEDVALSKDLRRLGRLELLDAQVTTSARRFEQGGVLRTLAKMTAIQAAYRFGVPAARLHRWYGSGRATSRRSMRQISLEGLNLWDVNGQPVALQALADQRPTLFVFLRWLG